MSVLAMPLSLGDGPGRIEDVEALVRKVVEDRRRQWGFRLKELDKDDLVSYLIGVAWELSRRYDPARDKRPNFAAYAAKILSFRCADWFRQRFGDTRHGEKPVVLSLDAPVTLDAGEAAEGADRLVDTLAARGGDPAVDRSPDLVGILQRGDRAGVGAYNALGEQAAGGAKGRTRSAAGLKNGRIPGTSRPPRRPPLCPHCFRTFRTAFEKVNRKLSESEQLSEHELDLKAARRSQAVRFGSEWACPRCTKLENEHGHELLLQQAYPNRQSRRVAAKAAQTSRTAERRSEAARNERAVAKAKAANQATGRSKK